MEKSEMKLAAQLGAKIEKLAQSVGKLPKNGRNSQQGYSYISHEAVATALRENLVKHKISIIPEVESYKEVEFTNPKSKSQGVRTTVIMRFHITDTETGYSQSRQFIGSEQDYGGKSMQQAVSQCTKYFYLKLFKITDKGDVDPDSKTTKVEAPQKSNSKPINNQSKKVPIDISDLPDSEVLKLIEKGEVNPKKLSADAFQKMEDSVIEGKVEFVGFLGKRDQYIRLRADSGDGIRIVSEQQKIKIGELIDHVLIGVEA